MKIGNVKLNNQVFLAPMAGVSDLPFRILCKRQNCALVYSEMVSAKGLHYGSENTKVLLRYTEEEKPLAVQIFGNDPFILAETAKFVEAEGAALVDINMGCPAPKIVKNGDGSALMRHPKLVGEIIEQVVKAVDIPVTVKVRKGWDSTTVNALDIAHIAQEQGAAAVAIHGRTREEFYTGKADWDIIKAVKQALQIPVIGNGDVVDPTSAKAMLDFTGCDAIMIGRAAQGNPWIFNRTTAYLRTGEILPEPSFKEKIFMAIYHMELLAERKEEAYAVREMRGHISCYLKNMPGAAVVRNEVMRLLTKEQVKTTLLTYLDEIRE